MFINISVNKWKKLLIIIILLALVVYIIGQILQNHEDKKREREKQRSNGVPLVIWWTPLMKDYQETRMCDKYFCKFTADRREMDNAKVCKLKMKMLKNVNYY